jgi:sucrose-6-phosphate hydrolase SacC (GH32 family)
MNHWKKQGLIFCPDGSHNHMHSHAAIPFALPIADRLRIYFSARNRAGKSLPFFLETDATHLQQIQKIHTTPLLPLGDLGTFDDSGIMPSCVVAHEGLHFMYYIGWNPQVTVSYRLSIGLAISSDGGTQFKKYATAPISDRSLEEPYFNTAPFVIKEGNTWKMWYISTTAWHIIDGYPEPQYHVKYAESDDGIHWRKTGVVCIDYDASAEAIGRPCVFVEDGLYKMYYSYRMLRHYRTQRGAGYQIGYAESKDGLHWEKKNEAAGIALSDDAQAWDYQMMEYCHVLQTTKGKLMLYNGNGFGKTGFGYAAQ